MLRRERGGQQSSFGNLTRAVMLRLLILQYYADLSDREASEQVAYNPLHRAFVRLVEAMLAEGVWPVSFVGPDARWGHKSEDKVFCGYKTHEALDPQSRMVTGVDVVPGNANEAVRTAALLGKDSLGVGPGTVVIADGLYNNATTAAQVQETGARGCFSGLKAERISDGFAYEAGADRMIYRGPSARCGWTRGICTTFR